jgi:hypothetical protein
MGMFDTIHLKHPLVCPVCGGGQYSHQTHAFEDVMAHYRIGSLVSGGGVLSGIVQETLWCAPCHQAGNRAESPVFLVIWHSILAGVEQDLTRAEARLSAVDRLDLIGWLDEAQRNENTWKRRFYGFFHDVRRWSEHLALQQNPEPVPDGETAEQTERRKAFAGLWRLPEEILSAPDPLAAIIEKNTPEREKNQQDDDIWQ